MGESSPETGGWPYADRTKFLRGRRTAEEGENKGGDPSPQVVKAKGRVNRQARRFRDGSGRLQQGCRRGVKGPPGTTGEGVAGGLRAQRRGEG